MKDYMIRGTGFAGKVRAFAVCSTSITDELSRRHQATPTVTAALGRTVAASLMMGAMLKGEEKLTVQVQGGGPIGQIIVDSNAYGEVRGYISNPTVDLPLNAKGKLDVAGAVGTDGALYIIKDLGLKEPYRGSTPIISGELAEDFTYYFTVSEQTPSAVSLGVLVDVDYSVKAAGGFIIQLMPGLTDEEITELEQRLSQIPSMTTMLERGLDLEQILGEVLPSFRLFETMDVSFKCKCSRERVEETLVSLGKAELEQLLTEDGKAEIQCHFCNETFGFTSEDIQSIIDKL
ncbi:Hsp33 family molecular chaperone HslO [Paenibacillus sp. N1-5-1-14]|uniref:Hsp33 family molecular chaperone HslO n=1 Tax=Paenibacillus radicibacter TaxID=2972488 RepID=UPI0021595BDA|nr:Hsp33 family molecular chaperone HslO [Paenibacillus radicibacter]MCR8645844.1 Hsp33 family molecular chaperone HslO [Paenibacillus radicibacter]